MKTYLLTGLCAALLTLAAVLSGGEPPAVPEVTPGPAVNVPEPVESQGVLADLVAAYNGESNAYARYTAFAAKAEAEGFPAVAALFHAAARAEQAHATNFAVAIVRLEGTPRADLKSPVVKSTAENLRIALEGERYERDNLYPAFLAAAQKAEQPDAVRVLNFALAAEREHAALCETAAGNLDAWKTAREFYVCPVCGKTVSNCDFEACPVCSAPRADFEKFM